MRTVFLLPTIIVPPCCSFSLAMLSAFLSGTTYESLSLTIVGCVGLYLLFKISKLLLPTVERMHERTLATRGPPARQETIELVSAENGGDA